MELVGSKEAGMSMEDMEGYDEMMAKLLAKLPAELRLAGLPAELRLAGLPADQVLSHYGPEEVLSHYTPEERLADLDRDHQALALPIEVLRLLPEQYLGSLSAEVQAEIRRRLQRAAKDEPPPL
jgi:hypothetical protein